MHYGSFEATLAAIRRHRNWRTKNHKPFEAWIEGMTVFNLPKQGKTGTPVRIPVKDLESAFDRVDARARPGMKFLVKEFKREGAEEESHWHSYAAAFYQGWEAKPPQADSTKSPSPVNDLSATSLSPPAPETNSPSRGGHDRYGKQMLNLACKLAGRSMAAGNCRVVYAGETASIDACIDSLIAVEVESRTGKQIRGAILDLIHHTAPAKLLVIQPVWNQGQKTAEMAGDILGRHFERERFRVVVLGTARDLEDDSAMVSKAIVELHRWATENRGTA
jgi:hypothetical protein